MKRKAAFAARMQTVVILSMIISFLLIIQEMNDGLHKMGLLLLIISAISQMAFGNMPPEASFKQARKIMIIAFSVVVCMFVLGILLAPVLIRIGR